MKLFNKGLDLEKDRLRIEFDLEEMKYIVYQGWNIIPFDKLNKKSQKLLQNRNYGLINNPDLLKQEINTAKIKLRFDKLKSMGYSCDSFEYLGENKGTMSKKMEEYLTRLTSEENILLGIHRVGQEASMQKINDILTNGLLMTGHLDGAAQINKDLKQNVSYYPDNKTIIKELMYADTYKNSKGSFLIRIPDDDLKGNIYIKDTNGSIRLNPKYILGYIPLEENHHIEKVITKPKNISSFKYNGETLNYDYNKSNSIVR